MNQYFMPIYTTIVGALIGFLIAKFKDMTNKVKETKKKEDDIADALKDGMAILLRKRIYDYYEMYEDESSIPASEWTDIQQTYSVYKRLGGNHTGDRLFEAMQNKHLS